MDFFLLVKKSIFLNRSSPRDGNISGLIHNGSGKGYDDVNVM